MTVARFNPFQALEALPNDVRFFQDAVSRLFSDSEARPWAPAVDIHETANELVVKADLPEVELKDIDIQIENGALTIKGQRKFESENKGQSYHRIERSYGSFARTFGLPETVDPNNVNAEYRNGVLTVTLGKKEIAKPRSIKVKTVE
jgi:HSP20 family protein